MASVIEDLRDIYKDLSNVTEQIADFLPGLCRLMERLDEQIDRLEED